MRSRRPNLKLRNGAEGVVGAIFLGALLGATLVPSYAQTQVRGRPCEGQYGFTIIDVATGATVVRGWTTPDGGLGDGISLGPGRDFKIEIFDGVDHRSGGHQFRTGPSGAITETPKVQMGDSIAPDSDDDGVPDDIEVGFGTNPFNPSTYGGGISDQVIVTTPPPPGTPPGGPAIPGIPTFGGLGIVNAVQREGICVDVTAFNDMVALACLDRGVSIFNVFGGMTPRLIAVIDTPGEARAVSMAGPLLAVADGPMGLAIIDVSDPSSVRLRSQVALGGYAQGVASDGPLAYVALQNGQLVVVDLNSGTEVQRINFNAEVFDTFVSGDNIWAFAGSSLISFDLNGAPTGSVGGGGGMRQVGSVALTPSGAEPLSRRKRLFVGGGRAFTTASLGYDDINVQNPAAMMVTGRPASTGPGSFKHIVANGSGRALAAVGINPRSDGSHDIYFYDVSNPTSTTALLTIYPTPGTAYANVIYNGLDYVADGERGLQVIRYLDIDRTGQAPTVSLTTSAVSSTVEEGKILRVTANAVDDVQVRNVEFYVDGQRAAIDGNFPFEFFQRVPLRSAAQSSFSLRARAFDTGGNSTWSDTLTISIASDSSPPFVSSVQPAPGLIVGQTDRVLAFFNESLRPETINAGSFQLVGAGADGILNTTDDFVVGNGSVEYQDSSRMVMYRLAAPLSRGLWRGIITTLVSDRAGNAIQEPITWTFQVFDQPDVDRDGVPDALEISLGLNPANPDTNKDGVRDGDSDPDNDGVSTAFEVFWGFNPAVARSRDPNILDGNLDLDNDFLTNRREELARSNPLEADSDKDSWSDEAELTGGSDAMNPQSTPRLFVGASPPTRIFLANYAPQPNGQGGVGLVVSRPPLSIVAPSQTVQFGAGVIVSRPPLSVLALGQGGGVVVSRPPVAAFVFGHGTVASGVLVAQPPVKISFATQ